MTIFTIGHSTRSLDDFVALLQAHGVTQLADIRTLPRSRRHPHFSRDALAESLPSVAIAYRHMPELGGLRKPRRDSRNTGWRNTSFRGYADYMETPAFAKAIDDLIAWAQREDRRPERAAPHEAGVARPFQGRDADTAIMCAEAVWWQCHRQLVADALVARGLDVRHIMSASAAPRHTLTDFARVEAGDRGLSVTYPGLL